jgi:cell division transport system permease protein
MESSTAVREARYISREEAVAELNRVTGDAGDVLGGLDTNPLPPTLEIHLRPEAVTEETVGVLTRELEAIDGVDEVLYGKKLLSVIQSVMRNTEVLGLALVVALSAGVVFVCYSTVKILLYRKQEEIETLKLLGATRGFIRAPFLMEGSLLGVAGGTATTLVLLGIRAFVTVRLADQFPLLMTLAAPPALFIGPPAVGLLIGLVGAFVAIGRIKY